MNDNNIKREVWVRENNFTGKPLKAALTRRGAEPVGGAYGVRTKRYIPEDHPMLVDYAELLGAMQYLHGLKGYAGTDIMTPEKIIDWAKEAGWKP